MNGNANISTELLSAVEAIKTAILQSQARAVQVRSGGQTVTGFGGSDPNALYLPLITDGLYEAYYTTKDKKEKDVEVVAGQLNVVSYTQQSINVCLVGVNGTRYQNSISELAAYLNQVFGQAVTNVNLTTASIDVDKFNGTLSAKESGALSAYNSDMKKLIRKVKKLPDYNSDTYYIMLVAKSDNPALGGFMPVNSNFGFVFAQANSGAGQMNRTIAHELAHGAFRLWHTFSSENLYTAQQGTTRNLMDYNGTNAELYKYQWDYIHNPQAGIVKWLVDEDESEAWGKGTKYLCINTQIAKEIKKKYRYFHLPDGSVADYKDLLPSGFYTKEDNDAATSLGAVAAIREGNTDCYYIFGTNTHKSYGYGYSLEGKAVLQYKITPIANPNLEQLNPVRVNIEGNAVKTVDYQGNETVYNNALCDCNMAKFRELNPDMLISEPEDIPPTAPRWFYDKKTNEIIIVTEIHDLKWLRVTDKGEQYDLDDLVAQGATYHYFTEAELADSKYNWLRTDVINTMNEAGKYVTIGLAATIAAPYLIEYAMVYGEQALVHLVRKIGEKAVYNFTKGFTVSFSCDMLVGIVLDKLEIEPITPSLIEEWILDASSEGVKEVFLPDGGKYHLIASAGIECLTGINILEIIENVNSDTPTDKIIEKLMTECVISAGIDILGNLTSNKIDKIRNSGVEKIMFALRKISFITPDNEIEFLSKICRVHDEHWLSEMQRIFKEQGYAGFDFLKDISFDYTKLSLKNFERLSRIVGISKVSPEAMEKFKNLLSQGRDANRMIRHINDMGCSVDGYTAIIDNLLESNEFKKTITIKGKKMNVKEFFLDDNMDAVKWYYKRDDFHLTYYKVWEGETREYLEISYDIKKGTIKTSLKKIVGNILDDDE